MVRKHAVTLVDDDDSVREALPPLLRSFGLEVHAFASAEQFLSEAPIERLGCIVLDVGLPRMSGPELHREMVRRGSCVPVVFITARAHDELGSAVTEGEQVVACLTKPFSEEAIIAAVREGLGSAKNR